MRHDKVSTLDIREVPNESGLNPEPVHPQNDSKNSEEAQYNADRRKQSGPEPKGRRIFSASDETREYVREGCIPAKHKEAARCEQEYDPQNY